MLENVSEREQKYHLQVPFRYRKIVKNRFHSVMTSITILNKSKNVQLRFHLVHFERF